MSDELARNLARLLHRRETSIEGLRRLTGGANRETWAFELVAGRARELLILRRSCASVRGQDQFGGLDLETEARLVQELAAAGLPVPAVRRVLTTGDHLGRGYIMRRLEGETLAPRILRRDQYANARGRLAGQCGAALAAIHTVDSKTASTLPLMQAEDVLESYHRQYRSFGEDRPVFELAFRWLYENLPPSVDAVLVHGDFRNGNLVVDEQGLVGVLDWELAHRGDPMEDLGWITVNSWRFGVSHRPVGGFGQRRELLNAYRRAGGIADEHRMHYWQLMGSLKWGVICMTMTDIYRRGIDRSVERAAIGRRVSEAEIDILNILRGRD